MELKLGWQKLLIFFDGVLIVPLWNWNRPPSHRHRLNAGFNRTFMELKFPDKVCTLSVFFLVLIVPLWNWNYLVFYIVIFFANAPVLIVPLWNWNRFISECYRHFHGFNRTFMELKSPCAALPRSRHPCFNRTFMELKLPCYMLFPRRRRF